MASKLRGLSQNPGDRSKGIQIWSEKILTDRSTAVLGWELLRWYLSFISPIIPSTNAGEAHDERSSIRAKVEEQLAKKIEDHQDPVTWRIREKEVLENASHNKEETTEGHKEETLRFDWPVSMDDIDHNGSADKGTQGDGDSGMPGIPPELIPDLARVR